MLDGSCHVLYISAIYFNFLKTVSFSFKGGHTTEMMRLVGSLSSYYQPRIYIVAETDKMSAEKIISFEKTKKMQDEESSEVCN